jgi:hypothetical protein
MAIQFIPAPAAEEPPPPSAPILVLFGRDRGGKPRAAWFDGTQAEAASAAASSMKLRAMTLASEDQRSLAAELAHGRVMPGGKVHVPGARRDLFGRLVVLAGESAGLCITETPEARREPASVAASGKASDAARTPEVAVPGGPDQNAAAPVERIKATGAVAEPVKAAPGADTLRTDTPPKPRPGDHLFVGHPKPSDREQVGLGSVVLAHEGPDDGWWEAEVIGCNGRTFSLRWSDYPATPTILRKLGELALLPPGDA